MSPGGRDRLMLPNRWSGATLGSANSAEEREADRLAARALSPSSSRRRDSRAASDPHALTPAEGRPLDPDTRSFFEPRFGHDFGRVRVHAGANATEAALALGAEAFTVDSDIVLHDPRDAGLGTGDARLLAHELAHVAQQGATSGQVIRRKVDPSREGPGAADYAATLNAYLLHLHAFKNVPPSRRVPFNPYVVPTIEEVVSAITASSEFRDQVADVYERMFNKDVIGDIWRLSTEDERDRLLRPFVSGKGDFPEPRKDKAVA